MLEPDRSRRRRGAPDRAAPPAFSISLQNLTTLGFQLVAFPVPTGLWKSPEVFAIDFVSLIMQLDKDIKNRR
jgi:hypothetical protein